MRRTINREIKILIFFIAFLIFCLPNLSSQPQDYNKVKCIIHIHTDISTGTRPLESYVQEAKQKGIGAIVLTDTDWQKWEYGLSPLRRLIKKVRREKSTMTFGIEKYLKLITSINKKYKDVIVIDGVQTNPFYYWSGNFLKGNLTLNNRNKDMLVVGLGNAKDYHNMPLIANYKSRFDAYHRDKFSKPYQDLIDYVRERGGLIFWAHPEYEENTVRDGIILITAPYQWDLVGTYNYTGFGVFWAGYEKTGKPGGIWDRILTEYCQGKREAPVWAIGELDEEGTGNINLDDVVNVLYVNNPGRQQILEALKRGRCYVTFKLFDRVPLILEEFKVCDEAGANTAVMGEEAIFPSDPVIKIRISHEKPTDKEIAVKLIRNNEIINEFNGKARIEIEYKDEGLGKNKKYYYRLDVRDSDANQLISNPIFFKKTPKR